MGGREQRCSFPRRPTTGRLIDSQLVLLTLLELTMEAGTGCGRQAALSVPRKGQGKNICWEGAGWGVWTPPCSALLPSPPSIPRRTSSRTHVR